jgi:hypothetical protein
LIVSNFSDPSNPTSADALIGFTELVANCQAAVTGQPEFPELTGSQVLSAADVEQLDAYHRGQRDRRTRPAAGQPVARFTGGIPPRHGSC